MPLILHRAVGIGSERKTVDGLLFVVFVDAKILLGQVGDVRAFLVRHHHVHAHFAGFGLEGVVGSLGGAGLLRGRRRSGYGRRSLLGAHHGQ